MVLRRQKTFDDFYKKARRTAAVCSEAVLRRPRLGTTPVSGNLTKTIYWRKKKIWTESFGNIAVRINELHSLTLSSSSPPLLGLHIREVLCSGLYWQRPDGS
mmetsp:Transcript_28030/g.45716  ORF Transcript_28030/g.45716 Transcript_28030/m.45716 type:complete len:102 (+) Transcript_28030:280-585(+)